MAKIYVLYNPKSGNGRGTANAQRLNSIYPENDLVYCDITEIGDVLRFIVGLASDDKIIIAGGDGTLNRFVNDIGDLKIENEVYFFGCGTGNDFLHDIGADKEKPVLVNRYIENLPVAEVNGKKYKFINGVGFGIDGYCCEEGDKIREKGKKKINYTAIAVRGLAYDYKRTNATVTVDGKTKKYKKVWLVPTMNGRYYGGGMMASPTQDRLDPEHKVTVSAMHGGTKLKTLLVFPGIFQGKHIEHDEMVDIIPGHEVEVEFDRPTALQIDGETVVGVKKYKVTSAGAGVNHSSEAANEAVGAESK